MKCDLHVHSWHSGMCTQPLLRRICRESYSPPEQVYGVLKKRGMNLVTLTDHDSIDGGEILRSHNDFFLSEEVTCKMPSGTEAHIGVYDVTERDHAELQRRRDDLPRLLAWLTERRLIFSINHMFSGLTGRRAAADFYWFRAYFPAVEARNGHMRAANNRHAEQFAQGHGKIALAGSDSHALPSAGRAFTEVPGARTKEEFLNGIRAGKALLRGSDGSYVRLTLDIFRITASMIHEHPWTALLSPFAALVPLATFANVLREREFARRWSEQAGASLVANDSRELPAPAAASAEVFAWP